MLFTCPQWWADLLFTNGICLGAGILVGYMYGADQKERLRRQVSTGMIAGAVFSAVVALLMILFASPILHLLQVEQTIMDESVLYLRTIMCGLLFRDGRVRRLYRDICTHI